MKAYKGFNKDMTCRGFQFEEGKTYHEEEAELCQSGFHACKNPLDCFNYYPPASSVYHEVELDDVDDEHNDNDSKICGKHIKVGAALNVLGICKAHFEYVKSNTTSTQIGDDMTNLAGGYESSLAGGDRSSLAGGYGSSLAGGDRSSLAGGDRSSLAGGDESSLAGGYGSSLAGRGSASCKKNGAIIVRGNNIKAKGELGTVIVIVIENDNNYEIADWKACVVDGKTLKPDTWYTLKNGEFVEVEADG